MKENLFLIFFMSCSLLLFSQDEGSFTMKLSTDTVSMGSTFQLSYSIENLEGKFIGPDISDFQVVSGPNSSSQFSSINGVISQKSSYSYVLTPLSPGIGEIGIAKLKGRNESFDLEGAKVVVLEDLNGYSGEYGSPISKRQQVKKDSLTKEQNSILQKLKKGKKRKI